MIHLKQEYGHARQRRERAGFTLAEVMFAVLILGIGLISIASLFPAAGAIQKNTMNNVTAEFIASNIEAKLKTRGINEALLLTYVPGADTVTKLTDAQLTNIGLPLAERVYPEAFDTNRDGTANTTVAGIDEDDAFANRQFYWRPLFMRDTQGNWKIFVFIQRRVDDAVPTVSTAGSSNAGDWTVSTTGTVVRQTSDLANGNWKGALVGNISTTVTVLTLSSGVVR